MASTPTFQDRLEDIRRDLRQCGGGIDPDPSEINDDVTTLAGAVTSLTDLVGVLADIQGNRPASQKASILPTVKGASMQYKITAQRPADSMDPQGTQHFEGLNFSEVVAEAEQQGYPRIIAGEQREVTPWTAITGYDFAEATP